MKWSSREQGDGYCGILALSAILGLDALVGTQAVLQKPLSARRATKVDPMTTLRYE